jgi:hypothetical protein
MSSSAFGPALGLEVLAEAKLFFLDVGTACLGFLSLLVFLLLLE